jgi:UDP-N-acetylglucosamine acyltransferase
LLKEQNKKSKNMTHPFTYIDPNAKIAPNVKIDPFTVIHGDVVVAFSPGLLLAPILRI